MRHIQQVTKVAHIIPAYFPVRGGIETLLSLFHPRMKERYGIESIALAPQYSISQAQVGEIGGLRTHLIPVPSAISQASSPGVIAAYFASIREILTKEAPDLVHIHGPYSLFHTAPKVIRSMGIPIIHHLHGELETQLDQPTLVELSKAKTVLAVSSAVAQSVIRHFPESKPIVIPNGIEELEPANPTMSKGELVIALVGRMDPIKGFDYALKAISLIKNRGIKIRVNIVGIGDSLYIHDLLTRLGLAEVTYFYGRCSRAKTLEVMRSSSLLVASSVEIEGFSIVSAEAGGVGIPVVAFDTGGLSETIRDGKTGTLVPNRDIEQLAAALELYANSPELRISHGNNALRHVRTNLSIDLFISRLLAIYQETISERLA